mmetsp:Transcript_16392/g.22178  ORF Transcript_16392/g.22178 Transcript_16392/m.22178 type:complete len:189 (+) Transcript_16392:309-875(+)|eukprot:CAMPEP_0185589268 /NCGR_PEP_ID=MMETSP0434-20130131/56274_1 /TAXON_ID=626734 ORGANISM="Favella taraikaensis, Strain Fe Narragansett Bay" /NCGR_SAMPLE_ID=MMETSP0434 /ASSEMBLY_ACC=CAM_ASM_000379 /LENGTH=188 /DNA_ID=CAMNT_0028212515 /DNA_START=278 /DNA_END=844 /DNA_ORIENTATION=-
MVMGVIEGDWLKVEKNPEAYEDALERLREEQSEGARINIDFFRDFESPVHPKYVVDRLQNLRFSSINQTLLHVAMGVHRTNPSAKGNPGLKLIESLIKNKFSMFLTDSEGQTPLSYLLQENVPEEALHPVVKVAVKYGFNLLRKTGAQTGDEDSDEEPCLSETFMMELFKTGKMSLKLFKLVEPLLRE